MKNNNLNISKVITEKVSEAISESARQFQKSAELLASQVKEQQKIMAKQFREAFAQQIKEIAKRAKEWQEEQKLTVSNMAEMGWFPNWYTFHYHLDLETETLDDFMFAHIDENWNEIIEKILSLCEDRKHILKVAFDLHQQENYIASIPLLLNQSDGICSEEYTYFFTKDNQSGLKASDEIIRQAESGEIHIGFLTELLLEPLKVKTQISQGSSKASKNAKSKGPNRHGIIHGNRKHLDYGSKLNGYKAFSFLAFIVFATKDAFKET